MVWNRLSTAACCPPCQPCRLDNHTSHLAEVWGRLVVGSGGGCGRGGQVLDGGLDVAAICGRGRGSEWCAVERPHVYLPEIFRQFCLLLLLFYISFVKWSQLYNSDQMNENNEENQCIHIFSAYLPRCKLGLDWMATCKMLVDPSSTRDC